MKARLIAALVVLASAIAILGVAQEAETFNFVVSDETDWLIESFNEIRIYTLDSETEKRIDAEPLTKSFPRNPIEMELESGFYEFVVWMDYIGEEIEFFRFEVIAGEITRVNLSKLELPAELMTY